MNLALIGGILLICVGTFSLLAVRHWSIDGTFSAVIIRGALACIAGALLIGWYLAVALGVRRTLEHAIDAMFFDIARVV